jgi:serine/threonine protein kinase
MFESPADGGPKKPFFSVPKY